MQRMICKKSGTKLAGQENTRQDRGKKGLERAACLPSVRRSHTKLNMMYSFQVLLIISLLRFGLWLRTSEVKVSVMEGFVALKEDAPESCLGLVHTE